MDGVSRRDVLKAGLAGCLAIASAGTARGGSQRIGGAELAAWAAAERRPGSLPFPKLPAGTDTMPKIEHILVVMMENHSYDNYLGMLGRGPGQKPRGDGFTIGANGLPTNSNPTSTGGVELTYHMPTTSQSAVHPSQEWVSCHEQYDKGRCDGFVTSPSGTGAMGYWQQSDLPFYYSLASTFPIADRWFCSVLGQTFPNRRYLMAATSLGMVDDTIPSPLVEPPNGTIFELLDAHSITWRDYYSDLPGSALWLGASAFVTPQVVPIAQFYTDAASGSLPGFAIIEPNYLGNSEESPQDILLGEHFVAGVVDAVFKSPNWPSTLLVWCYDEHGGYYDHVPPPKALAPDAVGPSVPASERYDGFRRYGFRVPAAVISPYSVPHKVTSKVHDHTSVLAMVERKWNLPALTYRDANAADLSDFINLDHAAFSTPPVLAPPAATAP